MICPDCGYDNIDGVDMCESCGQPLVPFDSAGSELEISITRHSIAVLAAKQALSVPPQTTVRNAVKEMTKNKIGCLLVLENHELLGIFSERDVLNRISGNMSALDEPVSMHMTPDPETVTQNDSIAYALHAMKLGDYRHLPVVGNSGRPIGIISIRDILRFLCIKFAQIRINQS